MKRALLLAIAVAVLLAATIPAAAQEPAGEEETPANRSEALRRIEMLRLFKLTEALELTQEDAAKLFPVIQRYDRQYRVIMEKKEKLMLDLQQELKKQNPDAAVLQKIVDEILALEREAMKLRTEQFKELKKLLTSEQYAKYLLFDDHFRRDLNRMLDEIRRDRRRQHRRTSPRQPQ